MSESVTVEQPAATESVVLDLPAISTEQVAEKSDTPQQSKRNWTSRKAARPMVEFMEHIVRPIMEQVATIDADTGKSRLTKNLGMIIAAFCGRVSIFPFDQSASSTNPFQTFSSDLTRFHMHPAYGGKQETPTQKVMPTALPLAECEVDVYPLFTVENGVPEKAIDRLKKLCEQYQVDHTLFTETGGKIKLTNNVIRMIAYFASDKGATNEEKIWGEIRPITHVPPQFLEQADIPKYHLKTPAVPGRKRGRPRKNPTSGQEPQAA